MLSGTGVMLAVAVVLSGIAAPVLAFNATTQVAELTAQPTAESVAKFTIGIPHTCWIPDDVHEYQYKIGGGGGSTNLTGNEKLIYATLLSALLASKNVAISTGGVCEPNNGYGYERILAVQILP